MSNANLPEEAVRTGQEDVLDAETIKDTPAGKGRKKAREPSGSWVYVGPSIHRTRLIANAIFRGTRSAVEKFLKSELETYPKARFLIVSLGELAEAREKIKSTGNILGRTYAEMAAGK